MGFVTYNQFFEPFSVSFWYTLGHWDERMHVCGTWVVWEWRECFARKRTYPKMEGLLKGQTADMSEDRICNLPPQKRIFILESSKWLLHEWHENHIKASRVQLPLSQNTDSFPETSVERFLWSLPFLPSWCAGIANWFVLLVVIPRAAEEFATGQRNHGRADGVWNEQSRDEDRCFCYVFLWWNSRRMMRSIYHSQGEADDFHYSLQRVPWTSILWQFWSQDRQVLTMYLYTHTCIVIYMYVQARFKLYCRHTCMWYVYIDSTPFS